MIVNIIGSVILWCLTLTVIVSIPAFANLARKIASSLNAEFSQVETKTFPDGEVYLRFNQSLANEKVVLIQSCYPQQDRRLIELFMMLDAAKDLGAAKLFAVVPYLAYTRQDKRFRKGETIGINTVAKLIESSGADHFLTFDVHEKESMGLFNMKAVNLSAMQELGKYLKEINLTRPCVIAPDKGSLRLAEKVADVLETDCTFFCKTRDLKTGKVLTGAKDAKVRDCDVVIVDDIISTGGTMANGVRIVKDQGAKRIVAACTHALLIGDAKNRLKKAGVDEIVGTDTIESEVSRVSVANIIAEALRTLV